MGKRKLNRLAHDLKEIETAINGLNMAENCKGIRARISSIIENLEQKYH